MIAGGIPTTAEDALAMQHDKLEELTEEAWRLERIPAASSRKGLRLRDSSKGTAGIIQDSVSFSTRGRPKSGRSCPVVTGT